MEEFDEADVLALIEKALANEEDVRPVNTLPLAWNEGRLLEKLASRLPRYLPVGDVQMLIDDLREDLLNGFETVDLSMLHRLSKNCRRCPAMIPDPNLPKWNLSDPDVVFVIDLPPTQTDANSLFIEGLTNAGFSSSRVMLTYVNRCLVKERRKPNIEEIKNCNSYLHTELQVIKPKLIVTLGAVPLLALLNTDVKLQSERGKIVWLGPWPILPTYSPAHALRASGRVLEEFQQDMTQAYSFVYGER